MYNQIKDLKYYIEPEEQQSTRPWNKIIAEAYKKCLPDYTHTLEQGSPATDTLPWDNVPFEEEKHADPEEEVKEEPKKAAKSAPKKAEPVVPSEDAEDEDDDLSFFKKLAASN